MTPRLGDWANRRSKSRAKAAAKAIATEEIATEEIATEPPVPLPSKLLVANRGEIAVRLCKSAKSLGVATVAIYTAADIGSMHVKAADEHYEVNSYIDEEAIVGIAVSTACTAVIPGYGFISESKSFAEACERKGIEFCGPGPEVLSTFGLKHTARAAAQKAGVPICLGTDVLETGAAALKWARETNVQYPLLFKAIAGGGGIGMVQVDEESEVEAAFDVASRNAKKAFGDGRMYVEQMLVGARHIEVQIFGDGKGDAVALGTRECSVQRRNQKVVEEAPAPNIPADRLEAIAACAAKLASSVAYNSAGTVEFLLDASNQFFFLEVNTRLQVEHGVTELIFGLDLVAAMIQQGNGTRHGSAGVNMARLKGLVPKGSAIECRVYAEDATNNFLPSPGVLGEVSFPTGSIPNVRVDTWVRSGTEVTPHFDPLIAKLMTYGETRAAAVATMGEALTKTVIKGSTSNLKYLRRICASSEFVSGKYDLGILTRIGMEPPSGMKVVHPGFYSSIQDYPGRSAKNGQLGEFWRIGIPPSGPMDDLSSRLANALLGNSEEAATLEFTIKGPTLTFAEPTTIAVAGANFGDATLDGAPFLMHTSVAVEAGSTLTLGLVSPGSGGQRGYLAVAGGFDVPLYLGSRSTFPLGQMGGHQGRPLIAGDSVPIGAELNDTAAAGVTCEGATMAGQHWTVGCVVGPHGAPDFLTVGGMKAFFEAAWRVHHNSNRNGVRLLGPKPEWTRTDGGAGGSHPSNVIDNEYAVGTINFTGDMPIFIGRDGPSLGGFVCNVTVPQAEMWKMGQVKPDDLITFEPISMSECLTRRAAQLATLAAVYASSGCRTPPQLRAPIALDASFTKVVDACNAVLYETKHDGDDTGHPDVCCRLQGDEYVLVEYGPPQIDLRLRFRVEGIERYLRGAGATGLLETAPGVRSLQIRYDNSLLSLRQLIDLLHQADKAVPSADSMKVTTRVLHLPCVLHDRWSQEAVDKYTQSNQAANGAHWTKPYLPDNSEFVAKQNGLPSVDAVNEIILKASYMVLGLGDVYLGCPAALPVDPTHRIMNPKYNPARTYTPQGAIGIGGTFMCLYPTASPGGYQLVGRSLPIWNAFCVNQLYEEGCPWLLRMFDQVRFYEVSEAELEDAFEKFKHGLYVPRTELEVFDVAAYSAWISTPEMVEKIATFESARKAGEASIDWTEPQPNPLVKWAGEVMEALFASGAAAALADGIPVPAPCSANVWKVEVKVGQMLEEGDPVVILEAMKMEYSVTAPCKGTVQSVAAKQGGAVKQGDVLLTMAPDDDEISA